MSQFLLIKRMINKVVTSYARAFGRTFLLEHTMFSVSCVWWICPFMLIIADRTFKAFMRSVCFALIFYPMEVKSQEMDWYRAMDYPEYRSDLKASDPVKWPDIILIAVYSIIAVCCVISIVTWLFLTIRDGQRMKAVEQEMRHGRTGSLIQPSIDHTIPTVEETPNRGPMNVESLRNR